MNIKDLLNIAGEQGKVVIMDSEGEVSGVLMSLEEYRNLTDLQLKKPEPKLDPEIINKEILNAQLSDTVELPTKNLEVIESPATSPSPLGNLLSKRAEELFSEKPFGRGEQPAYDMRSEVIDPNFGKPLQPVIESDNDEEIKPEFDDI